MSPARVPGAVRRPSAASLLLVLAHAGLAAPGAVTAAPAWYAAPVSALRLMPAQPVAGAELDAATRALAGQLRCPVCQGESLQDSPAEMAVEMRAVIREQLAAGRTSEEVKAYFVGRYGEWILLSPPARGFNLLLYVMPLLALLFGAAVVLVAARRWQRRTRAVPGLAAAGIDEDEY